MELRRTHPTVRSTSPGPCGSEINCPEPHAGVLVALRSSPLFSELPDAALEELLGTFRHETWRARCPAMTRVQAATRFYVIVSGRLKVYRVNPDTGREIGLMLLGPGDAFDVMSLLDVEPTEGSTVSLDDLEVVSTPLPRMRAWIDAHREFEHALHTYIARQMRSLSDLASELALYDTDARLARLILRHLVTDQAKPACRIDDLSHETIASLIGSVRVVVNRHIQEFKREGAISSCRGHLDVRDVESLERHSHDHSRKRRELPKGRSLQLRSQSNL